MRMSCLCVWFLAAARDLILYQQRELLPGHLDELSLDIWSDMMLIVW